MRFTMRRQVSQRIGQRALVTYNFINICDFQWVSSGGLDIVEKRNNCRTCGIR